MTKKINLTIAAYQGDQPFPESDHYPEFVADRLAALYECPVELSVGLTTRASAYGFGADESDVEEEATRLAKNELWEEFCDRGWRAYSATRHQTRIILDNGGGITLQLAGWAHHYDDPAQAARDLAEWLASGTTAGWEGDDSDAHTCDPTADEIRNGGYEIVTLARAVDTPASLAAELTATRGNAARLMASALSVVAP